MRVAAMDTHRTCQSDMTNEAVIRAVLPKHGPKRLSRIMDVPIETARGWYYRHLSVARTRDLALALLAEMDAEDQRRAAHRERLLLMAGNDGKAGGISAGAADAGDRSAKGGAPIGEMGRPAGAALVSVAEHVGAPAAKGRGA